MIFSESKILFRKTLVAYILVFCLQSMPARMEVISTSGLQLGK